MGAIPQTQLTRQTSGAISYTAASADGDTFKNTPGAILLIKNSDGAAPRTVTISKKRDYYSAPGAGEFAVADIDLTVPAASEFAFPVPMITHTDAAGNVSLAVDDEADVDYAVLVPVD